MRLRRVPLEGLMPAQPARLGRRGSLVLHIRVVTPRHLTPKQRETSAAWLRMLDLSESDTTLAVLEPDGRQLAAASVEGAALLGLGQVGQGAELLVNGLAALRADDGALTFYVDNAARWLAEYNHKRSSAAEAPKRIVMSQRVIQR